MSTRKTSDDISGEKKLMKILYTLVFIFVCFLGNVLCAIVGLKCSNGVVLATDNFLHGNEGKSLFSRFSNSIYAVTPNLALGCVNNEYQFRQLLSDITFMISVMNTKFDTPVTTSAVANFARHLVKEKFKDCSVLIAGAGGSAGDTSSMYELYLVTKGGTLVEQDAFAFGEGGNLMTAFVKDSLGIATELPTEIVMSLNPFRIRPGLTSKSLPTIDQAIKFIHKGMKFSEKDFSKLIPKPLHMVVSNEHFS